MEATAYIYRSSEHMQKQTQANQQKHLFHSRSTNNLLQYYEKKEKWLGCLLRAPEQITKAN